MLQLEQGGGRDEHPLRERDRAAQERSEHDAVGPPADQQPAAAGPRRPRLQSVAAAAERAQPHQEARLQPARGRVPGAGERARRQPARPRPPQVPREQPGRPQGSNLSK